MAYRTRRADLLSDEDLDNLRELHVDCFEDSAPLPELDYGAWWLVFGDNRDNPVAFAGIVASTMGKGHAYLKRAGVLPAHWGHGLQRRLIRVRERWARESGFHTAVTETTDNPISANNLIRAGYTMFAPEAPWGLKNSIYFRKRLVPC